MKILIVWLALAHSQTWRIQPNMNDTLNRKYALCLQGVVTSNQTRIPDLWDCEAFGDARDHWALNYSATTSEEGDFSIENIKFGGGCLAFNHYESDPRGASLAIGEWPCTESQALWTRDVARMQLINKYSGLCLQLNIPANKKPAAGCVDAGDSGDTLGCVHLFVCDDPFDNRTMWHFDPVTVAPTSPTHPTYQPTYTPTKPTTLHPTQSHPTSVPTLSPSLLPTNQPVTPAPTSRPTLRPTPQPTLQPTSFPTTAQPTPLPTPLPTASPTRLPTTSSPTRLPTTSSPTTANPTLQPTVSPTLSPTTASPTSSSPTTSPTVTQPTLSPSSPYVNHFSTVDNAYGIPVSDKDGMNVIFVLGDYGSFLLSNSSKCCQNRVAKSMLAKKALLESQGYRILFVAALGDNFYWTGMCPPNATEDYGPCFTQSSGLDQWQHWADTYGNLTSIPWLAIMGNHDYGNSDVFAMCPEKAPRTSLGGQPYACNALDPDKGGYRPIPQSLNFHIPDFNYRYTLNKLNLEVYALDQNALYLDNIGGDASGRVFVNKMCGSDDVLETRLTRLKDSGEAMMTYWAQQGPAIKSQTRNVLLLQHYPGPCEELKALFKKSIGPTNYTVDVRCIFGHNHDTQCRDPTKPAMDKCTDILLGAGGGCCAGDPVERGAAGFGVIYLRSQGMKLEVVNDAGSCAVCTSEQKWWTENMEKMEKYWATHP